MFFLMLRQSFLRGWRRKALATATIVLAASLITALMNISIDVGDKMAKELKSYGANINIVPKSESISLEIGGGEAFLAIKGILSTGGPEESALVPPLPAVQRLAGLEVKVQTVSVSALTVP